MEGAKGMGVELHLLFICTLVFYFFKFGHLDALQNCVVPADYTFIHAYRFLSFT